VTHPSVETAQSGEAADAVRTLQAELSGDYSEIRSAEIQLTEAILTAHAVTVWGRSRLQDIQRQLIEAINNPVAALGTPAGERQFLMFLRSKVAEIQDVVDGGALSDEDHAKLTRALASGYLLTAQERPDAPTPGLGGAMAGQSAGIMPAVGSALGALPQAAQGAVAGPAQGAAGLAGAATPLAGLASGLLDRAGDNSVGDEPTRTESLDDEPDDRGTTADDEAAGEPDGEDTDTGTDEGLPSAPPPGDREAPERGPAQTRPAVSRQEAP
jgi:uncharacterized protein DUF4226